MPLSRSISPRRSTLAAKTNPIQSDPQLLSHLEQLNSLPLSQFEAWQAQFVDRLVSLLPAQGIVKASETYQNVLQEMTKFQSTLDKVQACVVDGRLKAGVRAQNAVNRLKEGSLQMEQRLQDMTVNTAFDKFQMAAVIVQNNFGIYKGLQQHSDCLETLHEQLEDSGNVDRQILDAMASTTRRIAAFADVTAYLGLNEIMDKRRAFEAMDPLALAAAAEEEEEGAGLPEVSKHSKADEEDVSISETEAETTCSETQSDFVEDSVSGISVELCEMDELSPEEREELAELDRLLAEEEAKLREEERLTREYEAMLAQLEQEEREAAAREEAERQARIQAIKTRIAALKLQHDQTLQAMAERKRLQKETEQKARQQCQQQHEEKQGKLSWREQQALELAAFQQQREEQRLKKEAAEKALAEKKRQGRMARRETRKAMMASLKEEEDTMRSSGAVSLEARTMMIAIKAKEEDLDYDPNRRPTKGLPPKSNSDPSDDVKAAIAKARAAKAKKKARRQTGLKK